MKADSLYRIKPLKWVRKPDMSLKNAVRYDADVSGATYSVERVIDWGDDDNAKPTPTGEWRLSYCLAEYYDEGSGIWQTAKACREAAEQDWLSRLLPSLELVEQNPAATSGTNNEGSIE